MRVTKPTKAVLQRMLENPSGDHYGMDLMRSTGRPSGTIYPLLARLEREGWLTSRWDLSDGAGPRRRLYRLTDLGREEAAKITPRGTP